MAPCCVSSRCLLGGCWESEIVLRPDGSLDLRSQVMLVTQESAGRKVTAFFSSSAVGVVALVFPVIVIAVLPWALGWGETSSRLRTLLTMVLASATAPVHVHFSGLMAAGRSPAQRLGRPTNSAVPFVSSLPETSERRLHGTGSMKLLHLLLFALFLISQAMPGDPSPTSVFASTSGFLSRGVGASGGSGLPLGHRGCQGIGAARGSGPPGCGGRRGGGSGPPGDPGRRGIGAAGSSQSLVPSPRSAGVVSGDRPWGPDRSSPGSWFVVRSLEAL